MPIVFVVQESPGKNLLPARDMGEIRVILMLQDLDKGFDHCVEMLDRALKQANPMDYLLPIGDPILIGVATAIMYKWAKAPSFLVLRWDRVGYRYEPMIINI